MAHPHKNSSLEPSRPAGLSEIGLAPGEAEALAKLVAREQGFILFTGPEGSGKSRTANALLAEVGPRQERLVSIEDPIEYSWASGRQMEIDESRGDTLELLFLDVVDEKPELFFLGEIRNKVGAWMCAKYAAKGHLAISTLPSCNATTALFQLERFGIPGTLVGETLVGVVAQRLFPRLCPECKETRPITEKEKDLLAPFTSTPPDVTGHPAGCPECDHTGYLGKKPILEIIEIEPDLANLIAEGVPISTIRRHVRNQGVPLLTDGGLRGIRDGDLSLQDVYHGLFLEELDRDMAAGMVSGKPFEVQAGPSGSPEGQSVGVETMGRATILVVEDEPETRYLVGEILSSAHYHVIMAEDGAEALLKLAVEPVDLILSDLYMPNLDGMKLLELVQQHGIEAPVVFLTGEEAAEVEQRSYELGAIDFIRKPVDKDTLLERLELVFEVLED